MVTRDNGPFRRIFFSPSARVAERRLTRARRACGDADRQASQSLLFESFMFSHFERLDEAESCMWWDKNGAGGGGGLGGGGGGRGSE